MNSMTIVAIVPLVALLVGAMLQLVFGRYLSRLARGRLAFACGLVSLAASLALLPGIAGGRAIDLALATWDRGVRLQLHVDGLSLLFMLMATGIGSAILLYCIRYMEHEASTIRFYTLMLTFIAGLVSLVTSANLLLAYLSWEVIGLCSYFLVGFWYHEQDAANGARKVLVMTHLPGYGLLAAILLLYARSGTFLWTDPALTTAFSSGIFFLMLAAAMAKSVIFPLHTWIPEAMNAPTPVSALLHSACYVKSGIYLIARIYSITAPAGWQAPWRTVVLALGCATMLAGALLALTQTDLKRLLAFSTISQLGHILTALGLGTALGVSAALFYTFSHGLFKGTLFLCAGAVQHATGTRDMRKLGGLAVRMPGTAAIWLIAAGAIAGVPLLNGFVAKWLLLSAALDAGSAIVVAVAWLTSLFTAFYMLKTTAAVFYGDLPAALRDRSIHDAAPAMLAGMGTLAGLCLVFGLAPQLLVTGLVAPAVRALGFSLLVQVSWLGVQTSAATLPATAAALIVVLAALAGWLAYLALGRGAPRRTAASRGASTLAPVPVFSGGEALPVGDAVGVVDFALVAEDAFAPLFIAADPDPLYLGAWRGIERIAAAVTAGLDGLAARPLLAGAGLLAVALAAAFLI